MAHRLRLMTGGRLQESYSMSDQKFTIEEIKNYLEGCLFCVHGSDEQITAKIRDNFSLQCAIDLIEDKEDGIFACTMRDLQQLELKLEEKKG